MAANQEARRQELYGLLGDLPDRNRPISCKVVSTSQRQNYILETLVLDLNGIEPVPAYFTKPAKGGPFPCILYNHAHGGDYTIGKSELLRGRAKLQEPHYAEALASQGIAALCIDSWLFGERRGRSEIDLFKRMLWNGQVLWGMMVFDGLRSMDYLCSRPDVLANRIGTFGFSMGSTMSWWLAALDERIKMCVDLCCLTDYQALLAEAAGTEAHGIYYFVPSLLKHFTTWEINALIAPRPHLSLAGLYDPSTPPAGLDRIDSQLKAVYEKCNRSDAWKLRRYNQGHFESAEMRAEIMAFVADRL